MGGVRQKAGEKGEAVKYIAEGPAIKKLQITAEQFRKLCVLKGVFPRQPKSSKLKGANKTFYLVKDIKFLAHDPLINTFREIKIYKRKLKHQTDKKNKEAVVNLRLQEPTYSLDRIIRERYPTFDDALRDLDDALSHIYLFSRMPSGYKYPTNLQVRRCGRLCREWEKYVSTTRILRKSFISIKGYYYQVDLQGHQITYMVPHPGSFGDQRVGVGMKTMVFFLELYETLMGFVLFRLYSMLGMKYPPDLDHGRLDQVLENLIDNAMDTESVSEQKKADEKRETIQKEMQERFSTLDTKKLLAADKKDNSEENTADDAKEDDEFESEMKKLEQNERSNLFEGLKFFIAREVPVEQFTFAIRSFGGEVSFEGPYGTYSETDDSITHQIVDRDFVRHTYLGRVYIQPQWIFDCINEKVLLPTVEYGPSCVLPAHLSPFVNDQSEGYVPKRREDLEKLKEAIENGLPLELHPEYKYNRPKPQKEEVVEEASDDEDDEDDNNEDNEDDEANNEEQVEELINQDDDENELDEQRELESRYEKELQAEREGKTFEQDSKKSAKKNKKVDPEEEKRKLAEMMLSKKERGRYLFHVKRQKQKQQANEHLMTKRKRIEAEKNGKKKSKHDDDSDE